MSQGTNYSYSWPSLLEQNGVNSNMNPPPHVKQLLSDYEKERRLEERKKARKFLMNKTLDELHRILGRYCGPTKTLISEKELGFQPPKDLVEKAIEEAAIEEILLGD